MEKRIYNEQTGISYTLQGDYYLPDITPTGEAHKNIGAWGMRHKRFLKENHRVLYFNLMTSGKLFDYLDEIERRATELFLQLVKELAEKENVTEKLKATDQMLWVQKINNIGDRVTEIVNAEIVHNI